MSYIRGKQKTALLIVFALIFGLFCNRSVLAEGNRKGSRSAELLRSWYTEYQAEGNRTEVDPTGSAGVYGACASYKEGTPIWVVAGVYNRRLSVRRVSIGYRAYKIFNGNRANGFVTVGHGVREARDNYVYRTSGGTGTIGRIEICRFNDSVDASFIAMVNQNSMTQETPNGIKISSSVYTVKKGNRVSMYGGVSGYKKNVEVCGVGIESAYDGITMKNTIVTELMSVKGDSGSPVFYFDGGTARLVGIVVADDSESTAVEPESKIRSAIGAVPY